MTSKRLTLVFVPGSWLSTDIYRSTASQLPDYHSIVIDQPTNKMRPASVDMHEDIDHTRETIENELESGNDVVVIGHSAGGLIGCLGAHGLSKAHRLTTGHSTGVVGYVGVASILPHLGKTIMEMNAEFLIENQNALAAKLGPPVRTFDQIVAAYKFNEDGTVDVLESEYLFYNDLPAEEAKMWIAKQEAQSSTIYNLTTPENPITDQVPSFYILTTRDNALPRFIQEQYALQTVAWKRENIFELDSDHIPHLSHPKELTELLKNALERIVMA